MESHLSNKLEVLDNFRHEIVERFVPTTSLTNVFIFTDPPIFFEGRQLVLNEKTSWKPLWGPGQVFLMLACDVDYTAKSLPPTSHHVPKPTSPSSIPTTKPTQPKSIVCQLHFRVLGFVFLPQECPFMLVENLKNDFATLNGWYKQIMSATDNRVWRFQDGSREMGQDSPRSCWP